MSSVSIKMRVKAHFPWAFLSEIYIFKQLCTCISTWLCSVLTWVVSVYLVIILDYFCIPLFMFTSSLYFSRFRFRRNKSALNMIIHVYTWLLRKKYDQKKTRYRANIRSNGPIVSLLCCHEAYMFGIDNDLKGPWACVLNS